MRVSEGYLKYSIDHYVNYYNGRGADPEGRSRVLEVGTPLSSSPHIAMNNLIGTSTYHNLITMNELIDGLNK